MFSILKQRTLAIFQFFQKHKPRLGAFVFVSILFLAVYLSIGIYSYSTGHLSFFAPHAALAAGEETEMMGTLMTWIITLLLAMATLMIKIAIFCLAFVIQIGGYNDYLNSTAVNVGWVMVRDVTNMFFVVILLLVAFGTILGLEQYEWKKMLVKFFFAAVLVNFSRIICGVIIDIGQVVMITFINGVAATAGGNLINAFGLNKIMGLGKEITPEHFKSSDFFIAAISAVVFSAMVMAMMVAFVFILLSRMIVLWILIVLSPFAFVLSVIPQTQKYASQWWSEFGSHVVVGPAIAFFMWLAFAVVGGGQINNEVADGSSTPQVKSESDTAGIGEAMDWNSMSNFAIALGILMVGAKTSQSLGTVGGSAMGKATDMGKKIAMVATGAGAALWAGKGAVKGAVATGKWAAMNVPLVGGKSWIRKGQNIKSGVEARLEKIGSWRNEGAKTLEGSSKKILQAEEAEKQKLGVRTLTREQKRGVRSKLAAAGEIDDTIQGGIGRFVKRSLAGAWETGGRADKKVKDGQDTVEALKKIKESNYSTSGTAAGIEKQYQLAVAAEEEKRGGEKKKEKMGAAQAGVVREGLVAMDAAKKSLAQATSPEQEAAAKAAIKKAEGHVSMVAASSKIKADISVSGYTTLSQDLVNNVQKGKMGDQVARAKLLEEASTNQGRAIKFNNDVKVLMTGDGDVKKSVEAQIASEEWSHSASAARAELVSDSMTHHQLHAPEKTSVENVQAALISTVSGNQMAGLKPEQQAEALALGTKLVGANGEIAVEHANIESASNEIKNARLTTVQGQQEKRKELSDSVAKSKDRVANLENGLKDPKTSLDDRSKIARELESEKANLEKSEAELKEMPDMDKINPANDEQLRLLERLVEISSKPRANQDALLKALRARVNPDVMKSVFGEKPANAASLEILAQKDGVNRMVKAIKASQDKDGKLKAKITAAEGVIQTSKGVIETKNKEKEGIVSKGMELRIRSLAGSDPALAAAYFKAKKDRAASLQTTAQGRLEESVADEVVWKKKGFVGMKPQADDAAISRVMSRFKGIEKDELVAMVDSSAKQIQAKHNASDAGVARYSEKDQMEDQINSLALLKVVQAGGYLDDTMVKCEGIINGHASSSGSGPSAQKAFSRESSRWENMKKVASADKAAFSAKDKADSIVSVDDNSSKAFKVIVNNLVEKGGVDGASNMNELMLMLRSGSNDTVIQTRLKELLERDQESKTNAAGISMTHEQVMAILKDISLDQNKVDKFSKKT